MSLLFETIKCQNRRLANIDYHNERAIRSLKKVFGIDKKIDFAETVEIPDWVGEGLYRCRVSYDEEISKVEFFSYQYKVHRLIKLVENPAIEYPLKYEDRSVFHKLLSENEGFDEVIIIKNDCLTDTTYTNLAFFDGVKWFTPSTYLLEGTQRTYLLNEKQIDEEEIKVKDLTKFKRIALINAMRGLSLNFPFELTQNIISIKNS
ncbi:4-amino-4-deoxychorismate lyase [Emticicia oligotrophica DSM 17448]|uniref:4-amino-4-deoxychorismate lyase n=1 Tax=Emticicia oligotrophica (strain DSM 17448 / CIP 109782 / MTCC 6937 / GPTSA100-15) TaxID=929562 RepID=A0ABM5N652_EMTOG|nr:aminotransferase class IV [Emticicia oligotrophica]AFK05009.1 4-amino-4-deoxychorismate lyase [Emticicia oligotrophica DSM 17448]